MSRWRFAAMAVLAASLTACGADEQELRSWMNEQQRTVTPRTEEVLPPKQTEPFRYEGESLPDPFSATKLTRKTLESVPGKLQPDFSRRREALEAFPLDAIRMVGHLRNPAGEFALLQAENLVYRVQVGNYAGQNFGRIVGISENEVRLRELVQDGAGDWVDREAVLELQVQQEKRK